MAGTDARRPIRETVFWLRYTRSRYAILFYFLLFMLVAMPVASTFGLPQALIRVLLGICLLAAVMPNATGHSRRILLVGVPLLVAARFAAELGYLPNATGLILALYGITGLAAAAAALRFAIRANEVSAETVYAALSAYLLAGLFFGVNYSAIEFTWPGSLTGPDDFSEAAAVYYSFVTLATLGYGDFLPRSELARGVAMFEVIGGQLYLAVLVARLLGTFGGSKQGG